MIDGQDAEQVYLSMREASERFDVSESTILRLVRKHGLTRYRKVIGDQRRYVRRVDLELAFAMVPEGTQQREMEAWVARVQGGDLSDHGSHDDARRIVGLPPLAECNGSTPQVGTANGEAQQSDRVDGGRRRMR